MSMCGPETPGDSCEAAKRPETPGRLRCLACAARRLRETPVSMCCPETSGDSWKSRRKAVDASVHTKCQPVKVRPWVFTSLARFSSSQQRARDLCPECARSVPGMIRGPAAARAEEGVRVGIPPPHPSSSPGAIAANKHANAPGSPRFRQGPRHTGEVQVSSSACIRGTPHPHRCVTILSGAGPPVQVATHPLPLFPIPNWGLGTDQGRCSRGSPRSCNQVM